VLGRARGQAELLLKEALHIQMSRGTLHPKERAGGSGLLDRIDEETGREGRQLSLTFHLQ